MVDGTLLTGVRTWIEVFLRMNTHQSTRYRRGTCPTCQCREGHVYGTPGIGIFSYVQCAQCRAVYEGHTGRPYDTLRIIRICLPYVVMVPLVLMAMSWLGVLDPPPQVTRLAVPAYPQPLNLAVDPMKLDGFGNPYESTTFDTQDTPDQVLAWFRDELTGTAWVPRASHPGSLVYEDDRGCPEYKVWITVTDTSDLTHVEVEVSSSVPRNCL